MLFRFDAHCWRLEACLRQEVIEFCIFFFQIRPAVHLLCKISQKVQKIVLFLAENLLSVCSLSVELFVHQRFLSPECHLVIQPRSPVWDFSSLVRDGLCWKNFLKFFFFFSNFPKLKKRLTFSSFLKHLNEITFNLQTQ